MGIAILIVAGAAIVCFRTVTAENQMGRSDVKGDELNDTIFGVLGKNVETSESKKATDTSKYTPDTFQSVPDVANFRRTKDALNRLIIIANRYIAASDANLATVKTEQGIFKLELGGSLITGTGLKYLKGTTIDYLDMWNTPVNEAGLREVTKVKDLRVLIIARCDNLIDSNLKLLEEMPRLQKLGFGGRKLTEGALDYLSACKSLSTLVIYSMNLTERGIQSIYNIKQIDTIVFKSCHLSADAYRQLLEVPHPLRLFGLDGFELTDRQIIGIGLLNSKQINLTNCQISLKSLAVLRKNPKFVWRGLTCDGIKIEDNYKRNVPDPIDP